MSLTFRVQDGTWTPSLNGTKGGSCELVTCVMRSAKQVKLDPPDKAQVVPDVTFALYRAKPSVPTSLFRGERDALGCSKEFDDELDAPAEGGRLPPETIQARIREHYGRLRVCYESGLARNRKLTGTIHVHFVIEPDGRVSDAYLKDNTLPDCEATRCMVDAFSAIEFPPPEGGKVTVVYPVAFAPG